MPGKGAWECTGESLEVGCRAPTRFAGFERGNNYGVDGEKNELDEDESPDYAKGSEEDGRVDAPTGKEALTEADKELPEDQAAFQTDSS